MDDAPQIGQLRHPMKVISPTSFEHAQAAPEVVEPGAIQEKLDALSADEPLPEVYVADRISLLVQSPEKLFLYWNHSRDPHETLRAAFGDVALSYRLVVRLVDEASGAESLHPASPERRQWFDVRPDREYRAEVGLFSDDRHPFIRLLSCAARTPRAGVAPAADSDARFRVSATEFARALTEAGYGADALGVALEETGARGRGEEEALTAERLSAVRDALRAELSALIVALATGEPFDALRASLSPLLARWLAGVVGEHGGAHDSARLLEILRTVLGFELSYDPDQGLTAQGRMRATWGASDLFMGPGLPGHARRPPHVWLPSMAAGLLQK